MATRYSPKTATDGLIFYYDTGNDKSYRGEPTTNLFPYPQLTNNADTTVNTASITQKNFGGGLIGLEMIQATTSDIVSFGMSSLSTAVSGATYTWSSYVHASKTGNLVKGQVTVYVDGVRHWLTNSNTWTTSVTECSHLFTPTVSNQWHRVDTQFTMPTGTLTDFQLGSWYRATSNFTLRVANAQLEVKSHPTQFTTGTRSNTDSLKDLTRRKTIDLSNVSFDSDAMLDFDGTSDYIAFSDNIYDVADEGTISELTISVWVKWDQFCSSGTYDEIISWWQGGGNTYADGFLGTSVNSSFGDSAANPGIRFGDGWQNTGYNFTAATDVGKWWNIVAVKTADNAYIYVNGVLEATKGSALSWGFNGVATIGRHSSGGSEFLNGKIGNIQLHSRALTAAEILDNFNALKGRFGI